MRRLAPVALALALAGCGSPGTPPEKTEARKPASREVGLRDRVKERPGDAAARFELAGLLERQGQLDQAAHHYAIVAQGTRGRFTRPWLCLARVELARGNDVSARRALEQVLAVVPEDAAFYVDNDDYQEAAIRLARLLESFNSRAEIAALQQRYLIQFHGDPEAWPAGN